MKKKNVVIAGGGTGGHIYPGIALAESLKAIDPEIQVHFVGASGCIEEKIVPKNGYPLHVLPVGRLHSSVSLGRRLKAMLLLPFAFIKAIWLYVKLKPLWILGIGGFASGPFVFVSALLGGKTAILEPNAFPGMANRWLSKFVKHCFVVFEETQAFFPESKVIRVGLPVRLEKQKPESTYDASRPLQVLVFGGSQGSRAVNNLVGEWVENLGEKARNYKIFHQIGATDHHLWLERYGHKHDSYLEYAEYIDDMPSKLKWADLVICRSGVGSVVEVAMAGKPALFIPLPTAADNHQVKNAQVLVNRQAAMMLEQGGLSAEILGKTIEKLAQNPAELKKMMDQLHSFDYSQAPQQILSILL